MKLTPLDIRHKEFKRGMRGYVDVEVDEFLDEVADEYERLFKENIDLHERVESLEEKVTAYQRIEDTLQKTLVNAQASAEELKQNANKQGQLVLQDAELKARQLVNEAYIERQAVEQSMSKLRVAEEDFRFKFRQLLDGYLRQLQETPKAENVPPAPPVDMSRQAEAIKETIARESAVTVPAAPADEETQALSALDDSGPAGKPAEAGPAAETTAAPAAEAAAPVKPTTLPASAPTPSFTRPAAAISATEETRPAAPASAPAGPAVAPSRGPSGVQAGVPRGEAALAAATAAAPAAPTPRQPAAADPEAPVAARPAPEPPDEAPAERPAAADDAGADTERAVFGETDDDLLADVDTGVNENEFKW